MMMAEMPVQGGEAGWMRRLFLALVLVGIMGLGAELVLLEHMEELWQWVPLIALALGFLTGIAALLRPGPATLRAFQVAMAIFVIAGALGVWLHYRDNTAFELEMDPGMRGLPLLWAALKGATPALAPGSLAHLGLLGLAITYRHPALRRAAIHPRETR